MKSTRRITEEEVMEWIGSVTSLDDYIELVTELANGDYTPKQLKQDVLITIEGNL